jgi:hypothetical protein
MLTWPWPCTSGLEAVTGILSRFGGCCFVVTLSISRKQPIRGATAAQFGNLKPPKRVLVRSSSRTKSRGAGRIVGPGLSGSRNRSIVTCRTFLAGASVFLTTLCAFGAFVYQDRVNWKVKARCVLFPLPILYLMFRVPTDDAGLKCFGYDYFGGSYRQSWHSECYNQCSMKALTRLRVSYYLSTYCCGT